MLFNLDASNRSVIGLEGRTCCYLHPHPPTPFLSITPYLFFFHVSAFFSWNDQALHFQFTFYSPLLLPSFLLLSCCPLIPHVFLPSWRPLWATHTNAWWSSAFFVCVCVCVWSESAGVSPLSAVRLNQTQQCLALGHLPCMCNFAFIQSHGCKQACRMYAHTHTNASACSSLIYM